jgi:hypothetical protein
MEIIVHGTKGGYKVLYSTLDLNILGSAVVDVRCERSCESVIGQDAYAIAFVDTGFVFTKYQIIHDVPSNETGNIAFSLYIPANEHLGGVDIRNLLDKLLSTYCTTYVVDNKLDEVNESWQFIEPIFNHYKNKIRFIDPANCTRGADDVAFIYYAPGNLQYYLDNPDLEAFTKFSRIYLIKKKLERVPENPLKVLYHNPNQNITKQISVIHSSITQHVNSTPSTSRKPGIKTIRFNVIDTNNNRIPDHTIFYKKESDQTRTTKNGIVFSDKEIDETWRIKDKAEGYKSENINLIPKQSENEITVILVPLKIVQLHVAKETGELISPDEIELEIIGTQNKAKGDKIAFTGNAINKTWQIRVSTDGYIPHITTPISPAAQSAPVLIKLKKIKSSAVKQEDATKASGKYFVTFKAGRHGKLTDSDTFGPYEGPIEDIGTPIPMPSYGYKFDKWIYRQIDETNFAGMAQFKMKEISWSDFELSSKIVIILAVIVTAYYGGKYLRNHHPSFKFPSTILHKKETPQTIITPPQTPASSTPTEESALDLDATPSAEETTLVIEPEPELRSEPEPEPRLEPEPKPRLEPEPKPEVVSKNNVTDSDNPIQLDIRSYMDGNELKLSVLRRKLGETGSQDVQLRQAIQNSIQFRELMLSSNKISDFFEFYKGLDNEITIRTKWYGFLKTKILKDTYYFKNYFLPIKGRTNADMPIGEIINRYDKLLTQQSKKVVAKEESKEENEKIENEKIENEEPEG